MVLFFCCVCFLRYFFFYKINLVFPYFDVTCTVYHIVYNKISIFYLKKEEEEEDEEEEEENNQHDSD